MNGTGTGLDLTEGNSYDLLVDVVSYNSPAILVSPEDASSSVLWFKVEGTTYGAQMPLGSPLDDYQIDLIETWINEGALNN